MWIIKLYICKGISCLWNGVTFLLSLEIRFDQWQVLLFYQSFPQYNEYFVWNATSFLAYMFWCSVSFAWLNLEEEAIGLLDRILVFFEVFLYLRCYLLTYAFLQIKYNLCSFQNECFDSWFKKYLYNVC